MPEALEGEIPGQAENDTMRVNMTRLLRPILALSLCIAPAFAAFSSDDESGFNWISNYDEAMRQAEITGKPVLLAFRCVP